MAAGKKNAKRRRAWILFIDETGISETPPVRRTWAPKGCTPTLTHPYKSWSQSSVAGGLAYRWDGRRCRLFFQIRSGGFNARAVLDFLRQLKRHFPRHPVYVIWDRLPAHRSGRVLRFARRHRRWLSLVWLPPYAPELNPVDTLWANLKGNYLANLPAEDSIDISLAVHSGLATIRQRKLALAFLRRTGLSF